MSCCECVENLERMYSCETNQYYLICTECGNFIEWISEV